MPCENKKCKWNLNFIFHQKTVGTKLHAFRGSKSINHRTYTDISLTILFSKRSGLLHYTNNWQQKSVHVTVCLVLNFRSRPHSTIVH